jgi:threo-3-hydroxy-L-aspartate ammonia-lyase
MQLDSPVLPGTRDAVEYADIASAAEVLNGIAHRTPVLTSTTADELTQARLHFKTENLQRAGAFKFRGAYNALARLTPEQRAAGVVAFSSGNHAQAIALAGKLLNIPAVIVMPVDAPTVKTEAVRAYGAEVRLYDRRTDDRERIAADLASERGLAVISPFDHPHVIAGQGTAAKELIEDAGPLDWLLVPCGGGGLLAGCAIAATQLSPGVKVIGVEPAAGDDMARSFRSGTIQRVHNPDTIADGARTASPGHLTFPLVQRYVHDVITVNDSELLRATMFLWERMKTLVEPTGALGLAALLEGKLPVRGSRVGIILSGGNADVRQLCRML